jgi:hypothetical protein
MTIRRRERLRRSVRVRNHPGGCSPCPSAALYTFVLSANSAHRQGTRVAVVRAAQRMCDEFLAIVAEVVGEQHAQRYAAILLTGAHGAAGLELSGLLRTDKWHTTADELIDALLAMVAEVDRRD